jgi:hypothetical protein
LGFYYYSNSKPSYPKLVAPLTLSKLPSPFVPIENRNVGFNTPDPNHNTPYTTNVVRQPHLPIRRISSNQMQERREKGLYYYCDGKYHIGHNCNRPKVYLLEGLEVEEVAVPVEQEGQIQEGDALEA